MTIGELEGKLQDIYEKNPKQVFSFRLSAPFPFRGDYDTLAFEVLHCTMTITRALELVELATSNPHIHYKGATLSFDDDSKITFAESLGCGDSIGYISKQIKMISKGYIEPLEPTVENLLSLTFGL